MTPLVTPLVTLIQARMSSSRLPGKVLMPLGDGTVLDQVVRRVQAFSTETVICTSSDDSDDAIEAHCRARGLRCVRGSRDDVFSRFRLALAQPELPRSEWFARVTADCPLISVELARQAIAQISEELDYIGINADALPRGLALELIRRSEFEAIDPEQLDAPEREHVTLHLYEHRQRYRCRFLQPAAALRHPQFRLTVDYEDDYRLLARLFERDPELSAEHAVARLLAEPALAQINAHCEQKAARPTTGDPA